MHRALDVIATSSVHAVLLYGPEGADLHSVAKKIARDWLGEAGSRAQDAFDRDANPDCLVISPHGASRLIKLGHITSGQKGDGEVPPPPLSEFIRMGPLYSSHKVVLIQHLDRMNNDASNALLKMLEEPPAYVRFVCYTHEISRIKPTILSRVLSIPIESIHSRPEFASIPQNFQIAVGFEVQTLKIAEADPAFIADFLNLLDRVASVDSVSLLSVSEGIRALAERYEKLSKQNARTCNAAVLSWLATGIARLHTDQIHRSEPIFRAHRYIIGNGNPAIVFDGMLAEMTAR
jgi:hypothetical protein